MIPPIFFVGAVSVGALGCILDQPPLPLPCTWEKYVNHGHASFMNCHSPPLLHRHLTMRAPGVLIYVSILTGLISATLAQADLSQILAQIPSCTVSSIRDALV
jgi:hypothetical protein